MDVCNCVEVHLEEKTACLRKYIFAFVFNKIIFYCIKHIKSNNKDFVTNTHRHTHTQIHKISAVLLKCIHQIVLEKCITVSTIDKKFLPL